MPGLVVIASHAHAEPIPTGIEAMLRAAKPEELDTTASIAKRAAPTSGKEIDALIKAIKGDVETTRVARVREQRFFQGWKGEGTLGASISSGNTDETGFNASLALNKRGIDWEHVFEAKFDYLKTNGVTERERFYAGYTGRYNLSGAFFFSFGLVSFERDTLSGINRRFTESLGLGLRIFDKPRLKWSVEAGPALRQTAFTDLTHQNVASMLARTNVSWAPGPLITLTEEAGGVYAPSDNSTIYSHAAATFKFSRSLGARLGFDVDHESAPPIGRTKTDTITRASVVYGF